jgi:hypothetical protein
MLRIGILSFHRSINYGAFLQCYSLVKNLREMGNIRVEVIDYQHSSVYKKEILDILLRGIYNFSMYKEIIKYTIFRKIQKLYLPLSEKRVVSDNITEELIKIIQKYDIVIVGSDEVWKISKHRRFPNIYWAVGNINSNAMSYAASANRTDFKKLNNAETELMSNLLKKMFYIGVRDSYTYEQIKKINPNLNVNINCDPTFAYPFDNEQMIFKSIERKLARDRIDINRPMIGITTGNRKLAKFVKDRFGGKYQIIGIGNSNKSTDAYLYNFTPFEWVRIFRYLSGCISGFFHATIFCIRNRTPFVSIDNEVYYLRHKSKIYDLLERNRLIDCYFNAKKESFKWDKVFDTLEEKMKRREGIVKRLKIAEDNEMKKLKTFNDFLTRKLMSKVNREKNFLTNG